MKKCDGSLIEKLRVAAKRADKIDGTGEAIWLSDAITIIRQHTTAPDVVVHGDTYTIIGMNRAQYDVAKAAIAAMEGDASIRKDEGRISSAECRSSPAKCQYCQMGAYELCRCLKQSSEISMLKECPFCTGEAKHYSHENQHGDDYLSWKIDNWISCEVCGNQTCMHGTREDACRAWNLRVLVPVSVEDIAEKLWKRDYPKGGSIYRTYESTNPQDKELYRKEVKFILNAAGVKYGD